MFSDVPLRTGLVTLVQRLELPSTLVAVLEKQEGFSELRPPRQALILALAAQGDMFLLRSNEQNYAGVYPSRTIREDCDSSLLLLSTLDLLVRHMLPNSFPLDPGLQVEQLSARQDLQPDFKALEMWGKTYLQLLQASITTSAGISHHPVAVPPIVDAQLEHIHGLQEYSDIMSTNACLFSAATNLSDAAAGLVLRAVSI